MGRHRGHRVWSTRSRLAQRRQRDEEKVSPAPARHLATTVERDWRWPDLQPDVGDGPEIDEPTLDHP
jgi:hypothetical protein